MTLCTLQKYNITFLKTDLYILSHQNRSINQVIFILLISTASNEILNKVNTAYMAKY